MEFDSWFVQSNHAEHIHVECHRESWNARQPEIASLQAQLDALKGACELALDFHAADTEVFVARYGGGMTTREMCDQIREALRALDDAAQPEAEVVTC